MGIYTNLNKDEDNILSEKVNVQETIDKIKKFIDDFKTKNKEETEEVKEEIKEFKTKETKVKGKNYNKKVTYVGYDYDKFFKLVKTDDLETKYKAIKLYLENFSGFTQDTTMEIISIILHGTVKPLSSDDMKDEFDKIVGFDKSEDEVVTTLGKFKEYENIGNQYIETNRVIRVMNAIILDSKIMEHKEADGTGDIAPKVLVYSLATKYFNKYNNIIVDYIKKSIELENKILSKSVDKDNDDDFENESYLSSYLNNVILD